MTNNNKRGRNAKMVWPWCDGSDTSMWTVPDEHHPWISLQQDSREAMLFALRFLLIPPHLHHHDLTCWQNYDGFPSFRYHTPPLPCLLPRNSLTDQHHLLPIANCCLPPSSSAETLPFSLSLQVVADLTSPADWLSLSWMPSWSFSSPSSWSTPSLSPSPPWAWRRWGGVDPGSRSSLEVR